MATSKGGRGNKSITKLVEEWVEQGFSATMIKELLKDAGYQKARVSQLLKQLKQQDAAAGAAEAAHGDALFQEHLQNLRESEGISEQQSLLLKDYIAWGTHSPALPGVDTAMGRVGVHQTQILTYLSKLRGAPQATPQLSAKSLLNCFSKLRTALQQLRPKQSWPLWAQQGKPIPATIKKQLAHWSLQDCKGGFGRPSRKHLFLEGSHVEDFALNALREHLLHGALIGILRALLLRVQSATNLRSGNLRNARWWDVQCSTSLQSTGSRKVFSLSLINTKCHSPLAFQMRATRCLDDQLSHHLMHSWWEACQRGRAPGEFLFPRCMANGCFDFAQPLSNEEHNLAVQACAHYCGLPSTVHELKQWTSTSVRRGNAVTIEVEVQRLRAQRNKQFAWGPASPTPRKHYCPEGVILQPGSLFLDTEDIDRKCIQVIGQAFLEKHTKVLCQRCGFPDCKCHACSQSLGTGHSKQKHTCWLLHYGPHPYTVGQDPILNRRVPRQWVEARQEAWAELAWDLEVHWDGSAKSYHLKFTAQAGEAAEGNKRKKQKTGLTTAANEPREQH